MRLSLVALAVALALVAGVATLVGSRIWSTGKPSSSSSELMVEVLDVGQADSILVRAPSGRSMLVDAGNEAADVRRVVAPALKRLAISSLDYLVLTHPDQDHVGGMPAVLDSVPVSVFVDSVQSSTNSSYKQTLQKVQSLGVKPVRVRRGEAKIDLGAGLEVQLLAPEDPLLTVGNSTTNSNSVVMRLTYGNVSAILTGDMEREAEERLLSHHEDVSSQILKVAHHGSRYGSGNPFLDAVRPEVAIISAGAGNSYGHPHTETLQRLERRGVRSYRTDRDGTVEVAIDRSGYRVTSERRGG